MNRALAEFDNAPTTGKLRPLDVALARVQSDRCFAGANSRPATAVRRRTCAASSDAVIELPRRPDASAINEAIPLFYIGRNRAGLWVAREARGNSGGIFLFKRSAMRFAKEESEPAGCAMMVLNEPLEFYVQSPPSRSVTPFVAPRRMGRLAAIVASMAAAGSKLVARLSRVFASVRAHREAIEQELFRGQYTLSSKSDDDLPAAR